MKGPANVSLCLLAPVYCGGTLLPASANMSWNLYPSYHPLYPGPDPSYLSYSCPGLTSVPETIANVNHSPRGNQDQGLFCFV